MDEVIDAPNTLGPGGEALRGLRTIRTMKHVDPAVEKAMDVAASYINGPHVPNRVVRVPDYSNGGAGAAEDKPTNPKDAIGVTKLPLHLFPTTAIALGAMAMLEGAAKYGRSNFRAVGVRSSIYYDAAMRHLMKWFEGEDIDRDSGIDHLGHALACVAVLIDAQAARRLEDDRMVRGGALELFDRLTPMVAEIKARYADRAPHHYTRQDVV